METVPTDSQDGSSSYVQPEAEKVEKKVEALGSGDQREVPLNPIKPKDTQQNLDTFAVEIPLLAANDTEPDEGEGGLENVAVEDLPEAGSDLEREMMARLLEYESPPPVDDVDDEEVDEGEDWTSGERSWWVWLWKLLLVSMIVNVFTMVVWNAGSSSIR